MEQQTALKLGKVYRKVVYCHCAYLTYRQSTSCEMLSWMKQKLKSRLLGEIAITSDNADDTTFMEESKEKLKSLLMKVKEKSEKPSLNPTFKKTNITASGPITM